jgi:squalene cyclase
MLAAHPMDCEALQPVTDELDQLLSRQNCDGGWSAKQTQNAESDPDVTGVVLEALSLNSVGPAHAAMRRGTEFLCSTQRGDGSWESATGVRLVHGTSYAVRGLTAAGVSSDDPAVAAGVNWLVVQQQECGGWGEAAATSDEQSDIMPAAASAMQTAWAVSALVATGLAMDEATLLGVQFLLETQDEDGDWRDEQFALRDPAAAAWFRSDLRTTASAIGVIAEWAVIAAKEQAKLTPACFKLVAT